MTLAKCLSEYGMIDHMDVYLMMLYDVEEHHNSENAPKPFYLWAEVQRHAVLALLKAKSYSTSIISSIINTLL